MNKLLFRQCDANYPFLWEDGSRQQAQRWNKAGEEEPTQYFADSPEAAWAEFIRHEEIFEPLAPDEFMKDFRRVLWAIEVEVSDAPELFLTVSPKEHISYQYLVGGPDSYSVCQQFAEERRGLGYKWLVAPSAAMQADSSKGYTVNLGKLQPGPVRESKVYVYFGCLPNAVGWRCGMHPFCDLQALSKVRRLTAISVTSS